MRAHLVWVALFRLCYRALISGLAVLSLVRRPSKQMKEMFEENEEWGLALLLIHEFFWSASALWRYSQKSKFLLGLNKLYETEVVNVRRFFLGFRV